MGGMEEVKQEGDVGQTSLSGYKKKKKPVAQSPSGGGLK